MSDNKRIRYFAASNSAEGFKSYYESVFAPEKYSSIYVIKGGPGTGKSHFIKSVAKRAEGAGYFVEYIYCSSDPTSLDGIVVPELRLAIIDGTPPHAYEPRLPGAVENIVNLGDLWNSAVLSGSRKIIENLNVKKRNCFSRAYGYLAAYKSVSNNMEKMIRPFLKLDKIKKFAARFASLSKEGEGIEEYRLANSIGMNGRFGFDIYRESAGVYYEINDYLETGHFLMREIYNAQKNKNADMYVSPNPILCSRIDAISILPQGLTFEIGESGDDDVRSINMKRFIDTGEIFTVRSNMRLATRVRDGLCDMAILEFESAKKYHFTLEEIYGAAMDFEAKEQFEEEFCKKIFDK